MTLTEKLQRDVNSDLKFFFCSEEKTDYSLKCNIMRLTVLLKCFVFFALIISKGLKIVL